MKKWLMVLDQVGCSRFEGEVSSLSPRNASVVPLSLDYLPRTTPVGHATISTGLWPNEHLIQGRTWCEVRGAGMRRVHRVAQLPNLFPIAGTVFEALQQASLAHRLRISAAHREAMIIAVATKDFIPFLFGAWDTDVSVYPRTTTPVEVGEGFAIDVVFDSFSRQGRDAVRSSWKRLMARATQLFGWELSSLEVVPQVLGPRHMRHALRLHVPREWGTALASVRSAWKRLLDQRIVEVDQFYTEVALELADRARGQPQIVLQSAVATDTRGHFHGPSSGSYGEALRAGITRALELHEQGWSVLATSDHGGRDTPQWWQLRGGSVISGEQSIALPGGDAVLESDLVVGYGAGGGLFQRADWEAAQLISVRGVSTSLIRNSFHPAQRPNWVVLPDDDAIVTEGHVTAGGGGAHGGCVEPDGQISEIDGSVPLWWLGRAATTAPSDLRGVASFFSGLR